MIREATQNDMPAVLALWMKSTIYGHPFIDENYWHESEALVRDIYLSAAQTWLYEEDGELKGFASIIENRFLAALFVAPEAVRSGIGSKLVQHVQQRYPSLILEVYQMNQGAVKFYHAQAFRIVDSAWQEETKQATWIMSWQAVQTP